MLSKEFGLIRIRGLFVKSDANPSRRHRWLKSIQRKYYRSYSWGVGLGPIRNSAREFVPRHCPRPGQRRIEQSPPGRGDLVVHLSPLLNRYLNQFRQNTFESAARFVVGGH